MKNNEREIVIRQTISDLKEQMVRWQAMVAHFVATKGIIIESSTIVYDREPGKAITYRFTTLENEIIEAEHRSSAHWPDEKGWEKYEKRMSVDTTVSVMYNPENPSDNVAFFDVSILEGAIEAAREVLHDLEMALH
ncbi:MAG: hypothetical protein GY796_13295 [Chloroflexi bacterium]|nr:hypothetical protein [Chloroflexota bacterium]